MSSLSGFSQYDRYRRPNGAGKTTFAKEFLTNEGDCLRFLNTDEIARGLSPLDSSLSQRQAGRLLLDETSRLIGEHKDFALESTLSGKTQAKIIESARNHHYHISLFYLWLPSAEESEKRVEQRVREGGHDVPVDAIHRRFPRSYSNFFDLYLPLAENWSLWDASQLPAQCVGSSVSVSNDVNQLRQRYAISTAN
jgi:predicted ABC-type ATPase